MSSSYDLMVSLNITITIGLLNNSLLPQVGANNAVPRINLAERRGTDVWHRLNDMLHTHTHTMCLISIATVSGIKWMEDTRMGN